VTRAVVVLRVGAMTVNVRRCRRGESGCDAPPVTPDADLPSVPNALTTAAPTPCRPPETLYEFWLTCRRMQAGEHDLGRRDALFQVNIRRGCHGVVGARDAAVAVQGQLKPSWRIRPAPHPPALSMISNAMYAGPSIVGVNDIHARGRRTDGPAPSGRKIDAAS